MKVLRVQYRHTTRNVFVYDGMSSDEVWSLLRACVSSALKPGEREPRLLALRHPPSGEVLPLSRAIQRPEQIWAEVELIDDQYKQQPQQTAAAAAPARSAMRPQSSPAYASGHSSSQAGLPTPIQRNASTAAGSRPLPDPASYGAGYGRWGYSSKPLTQRQNYLADSPASPAQSSPRFSPREGAASPALSAASSQASWEEEGRAAGSGVLVIMSYSELLNVLTGHLPPNINNGSTPRVLRAGRPHIFVLAVVRPGSDACEDIFPHYEQIAASGAYPNLVFLIVEDAHLNGTALDVQDAVPTFQFFLQGHLLGQVVSPTVPQLRSMCASSDRLCAENPDLSVEPSDDEADEEEFDEDDEDDQYHGQQSYSLGEAIDNRYRMSEEERREVFGDVEDEEARWAQLLQASPKASPKRAGRGQRRQAWQDASPSPSEGSEDEGYNAPGGLVIRGRALTLHPPTRQQLLEAQRRPRATNPEQNLRDWSAYAEYRDGGSDPAESSGVDESNYDDSEAGDEYHEPLAQLGKRKIHPSASSSDEEQEDEEDEQYRASETAASSDYSLGNSLTASPVIVGRNGPSSPNGAPLSAPRSASSSDLLMTPQEAHTIERVLQRADPDVRAAFDACPDLDSFVAVFIRLVHAQIQPPQAQQAAAAAAAQPRATPSSGLKRKSHPVGVQQLVGVEPRTKRLHPDPTPAQLAAEAAARLAAARELAEQRRHKRVNQQLYASSDEDQDEDEEEDEEEGAIVSADSPMKGRRGGAAGHARTASEQVAESELAAQQSRYAALQAEYQGIQNEIFSRTVHDLHSQSILSDEQLSILVRLWTQTERGSNAIRRLIQQYEKHGDELEFMFQLVQLVAKFEAGEAVQPSDSEEDGQSPADSAEEDEDEDDEEVEVQGSEVDESPLNSDEERAFQRFLAAASSGAESSPGASVQGSPVRRLPPRSSTKAPQSSPAGGAPARAPSAAEQQEAALESNLSLVSQLAAERLLTAADAERAAQYLRYGHPLVQAAFLAFSYNQDVEDLLDTLKKILTSEQKQQPAQQQSKPAAAQAAPAAKSSSSVSVSPSDVLALLPPYLVASHGPVVEQLVRAADSAITGAWDDLRQAVATKRGEALAEAVRQFALAVEKRAKQAAPKGAASASAAAAAPAQSASATAAPTDVNAVASGLTLTSVLHTGGVFDDAQCAVLFELILDANPTVLSAFDEARRTEEWDALHETLVNQLAANAQLKRNDHPLVQAVQQASGILNEKHVHLFRQMLEQGRKQAVKPAGAASQTTPQRSSGTSGSLPIGTPISPSIPQSAWSKMVHAFTRSLESLQSSGSLSDTAALLLIDLFQQRNAAVVSACQVLELDGNVAEFEDSLRVIAQEHAAANSPRTKERLLKRATHEEAGMESSASTPGETDRPRQSDASGSAGRERLVQSFAERVQAIDELERSGLASSDEEEEDGGAGEEGEDDGLGDLDDETLALLSKSDTDEWDDVQVQALVSKVVAMQEELARLKLQQKDERRRNGLPDDGQDEEEGEDEDDEEEEEEEQEDEEEEEDDEQKEQ